MKTETIKKHKSINVEFNIELNLQREIMLKQTNVIWCILHVCIGDFQVHMIHLTVIYLFYVTVIHSVVF